MHKKLTVIQYTIVHFLKKKNINHISDVFEDNGKMRSCEDLRAKLDFDDHKKLISLNQKTSNLLFRKIK